MNKRNFAIVSKHNLSKSNLTELNAADAVDKGFMSHSDWVGHIMRYGFAMKTIEKAKPTRVLDVGCGSMNLPKFLWRNRSSFHGSYVGIDLRAQAAWLEDFSWKTDMSLYRMDIVLDDPSVVGKSFPVVTCFEMFEHIPVKMQPELMKRLFNWTAKGGVCLFSTPNSGVAKSTADNHIGEDGQIRERTYKDKLKMAADAGFVVEKTFGTFCGSTRLPKEFLALEHIQTMKEFLLDSFFVSLLATGFPEQSNNALFVMRHP